MNFSCTKAKKLDAESVGRINNVSIIIDDQLWNGEIGDSLRNKFASPVIGLVQEEPIFTISQYSLKLSDSLKFRNRNIIIIKVEPKNFLHIKQNEFAKPQTVVHISGNSVHDIIDIIEINSGFIINKFKNSEIIVLQHIINKQLLNTKKINQRFKIKIKIPKQYKITYRRNKFVWIKKEIVSGSCSLLIYEYPIFNTYSKTKILKKITQIRDSIGSLYIHGFFQNTKMITDYTYIPSFVNMSIDFKKTIEIKGNWEMQNDNMSGPFINYTIFDPNRKRILVLEGFCYAPSKEKRDYIFELEAIIKSVKFDNSSRKKV